MNRPTVIDLFCGAGGFSEGFRQQGFIIIKGYDKWQPAIDTFNFNFGTNKGELLDILKLNADDAIDFIENNIPDTDVIIGSPPCVSFSNSNRSGKADKSMGIKLIETFLKVVAIKKHKKGSILKAWFMENVAKSILHLPKSYSFETLGLENWAMKRNMNPKAAVFIIQGNSAVLNSADYGSPQQRLRAITGEIIKLKQMVVPEKTYSKKNHITIRQIRSKLPPPNSKLNQQLIRDPLYSKIVIDKVQLTDHFYDTGLYEAVWLNSKYLKINHPYMGRMSFPEDENKPSRTVTATNIRTSREALIYKSEYSRSGDGEYRTPTVREAATLMSFPITFQFIGTEGTKWKLIGNAVCPSISRALASTVRTYMNLNILKTLIVETEAKTNGIPNLNTFSSKTFDSPPKRNKGSKFRRHLFKDGNITVTLSNYEIKGTLTGKWMTSVQYGNGDGFPHENYPDGYYKFLEKAIKGFDGGDRFIEIINNGFSEKVADAQLLQQMYEEQKSINGYLEPSKLIDAVGNLIHQFNFDEPLFNQNGYFKFKSTVPKKQFLALYAINKITTIANKRRKMQ